MSRNLAVALLLLPAPAFAQNAADASPGFSNDFQTTPFKIVDGNSHRPIEGAEFSYQCSNASGTVYSGPGGAVAATFFGETACDLDIRIEHYRELKKSWKASDPRTIELLPADAEHPGWVDPNNAASSGQEMASVPGAPNSSASGPEASPWQVPLRHWLEALAAALLPALAFFALREIAVRTTLYFMMRKGGGEPAAAAEEEAAAPPAPPPPESIEIGTLNGLLLQGPSQARLERALHTHRDKYALVAKSLVPQIVGLSFAIFFAKGLESWVGWIAPGVLLALDLFFLLFLWSLWLQGKRLIEAAALAGVLAALAYPLVGLFTGIPLYLGLLPALLQAFFLVFSFHRLRRAARGDGSKMLVVLRVFNADGNAAFVFGPLMAMWRFLGPYVTVSDPSYVRYQFTIFQRSNITKTLGATLTIALAVFLANHLQFLFSTAQIPLPAWLDGDEHARLLKALVYAAVAVAAIVPAIAYIWRRFLKRPEQAVARIDRTAGARLGVESDYRGTALFCFDDVWKPAVGHMLELADVVLMDLRGFSAERQGCAYEIGQLIDRFPLERLLFLIDASTPRDLLDKLIRERWATMAADSPNRGASLPLIRFYETGDRRKHDIINIIGLLSMSLEGGASTIRAGGLATN